MKKLISLRLTMLLLIISLSNSACSSQQLIPSLENRTLYIDPYLPGVHYEYEVCVKKFLFVCTKKEWVKDYYDFTDPKVRQQLIDMGFKLRVLKFNPTPL